VRRSDLRSSDAEVLLELRTADGGAAASTRDSAGHSLSIARGHRRAAWIGAIAGAALVSVALGLALMSFSFSDVPPREGLTRERVAWLLCGAPLCFGWIGALIGYPLGRALARKKSDHARLTLVEGRLRLDADDLGAFQRAESDVGARYVRIVGERGETRVELRSAEDAVMRAAAIDDAWGRDTTV
jgi:hypothetical protein